MIAVATVDAWTTAQITLDDGLGAQSWSPLADQNDAKTAADAFTQWVDFTFGDSTSWEWARHTDGSARLTFALPNGYTMTTNAAAQSILGADASGGPGMTSTDWTSPAGSIAPSTPEASPYVDHYMRTVRGAGMAAASGVARAQIGGTAPYAPRVRWAAYAVDTERLRAVLADAASPRQANIYGGTVIGWFLASLGRVDVRKRGPGLWRVTAEVRA